MKVGKKTRQRINHLSSNRKGMLLAEETLKIVLAVIVLGFLIYFLANLYMGNLKEVKQKQAEATLKKISEIIYSEQPKGSLTAITPERWFLFSFVKETKPNSCAGESCLCICKRKIDAVLNIPLSFEKRQAKECSDDGACLNVKNLEYFDAILIKDIADSPTNINVNKIDGKITINEEI